MSGDPALRGIPADWVREDVAWCPTDRWIDFLQDLPLHEARVVQTRHHPEHGTFAQVWWSPAGLARKRAVLGMPAAAADPSLVPLPLDPGEPR